MPKIGTVIPKIEVCLKETRHICFGEEIIDRIQKDVETRLHKYYLKLVTNCLMLQMKTYRCSREK